MRLPVVSSTKGTPFALVAALLLGVGLSACTGRAAEKAAADDAAAPKAIEVATATAKEQPIERFLTVTGTLNAQEEADVAAEVAGRVVTTPVERGSQVTSGGVLIRIADVEVTAQVREAEANAAQIEARLGMAGGAAFDVDKVPEVATARAAFEQSQADFSRVQMLFTRQLVSQAEFDTRRTQAESSRRQYEGARNGAEQNYQALMAARARVTLARKALEDTVVRAPFAGVVGQRLVSVGDYVLKGTKVATVLRTDPLRVELTVPEQYITALGEGREVSLVVDAWPGRTFVGHVRYVSPALKAESRSLTVEAIVDNRNGELKPGFFAQARIQQAEATPGIVVPASAIRTSAGTQRVFVSNGQQVEERIVTTGQALDNLVEVTSGLKAGEVVATSNVLQLEDGVRVAVAH